MEDAQTSATTGEKAGYGLTNGTYLVEKLAHLKRERIPERVAKVPVLDAGRISEIAALSQRDRMAGLACVGASVLVRAGRSAGAPTEAPRESRLPLAPAPHRRPALLN